MPRWSDRAQRRALGAFFRTVNTLDAWASALRARQTTPRVATRDHRTRELGRDLVMDVYWIERPGEVGPGVSVFWSKQEIYRADLFPTGGHIHYGLAQALIRPFGGSARVYLPDQSIEGRAERARFDIANNLAFSLRTHPSRRARAVGAALDPGAMEAAAAWLHEEVLDLARTHG